MSEEWVPWKERPEYKALQKKYNKEYWSRNKERYLEVKRRNEHKRRLKRKLARPEQCEVCGCKGVIVWDHCHVTSKFRGWLCNGCNSALGFVKDNPDTLRKLTEYLERTKGD